MPKAYIWALERFGGQLINNVVLLYAAEEVVERNETFETKQYCPGYIAIGDDSGGRAIVIPLQGKSTHVSLVDHGSMSSDDFELLDRDLIRWVEAKCPLA